MQPWDGSGSMDKLTEGVYDQRPKSWSPDGQHLAYVESHPETGEDIYVLRMEDWQSEPFANTEYHEHCPEFSPDGRWLAYISNESGQGEVYVRPFPGPGGKVMISTNGGRSPLWAPNGRELYYRDPAGTKVMAVEITTEPSFNAGIPRLLFEVENVHISTARNYDISTDGRRFLMQVVPEVEIVRARQMRAVLNWFEELKRLVPTEN
jgi:Tol biopolymer transport system component